jgi:hypothetical protein
LEMGNLTLCMWELNPKLNGLRWFDRHITHWGQAKPNWSILMFMG